MYNMAMKILITSGGTTEKIDTVRSITNHATGTLGKIIAEKYLREGHQVTLVTTKNAVKPESATNLSIFEIEDVDSLIKTLKPLVKEHDILIHSMAVSDYTPVYMADFEKVKSSDDLDTFLRKDNHEGKISSESEYQVLFLKKTPKVISLVKKWNPQITLVGFKLLVNVTKENLFKVARHSLIKNKATFILANDLIDITSKHHIAYLLDHDNVYKSTTKEDIAQLIYEKVKKYD